MAKIIQHTFYILIIVLICGCDDELGVAIEKYDDGNYTESIKLLNDYLKEDTANPMAYQFRGLSYYKLNKKDSALFDLSKYVIKQSEENYDTTALFVMAKLLFEKGRYDDAIAFLDGIEALSTNKYSNIEIYHYRGLSHIYTYNFDKARDDFRRRYLNDTTNASACNDLGYYFAAGIPANYDSSIYYYTKSLNHNDTSIFALYNRGTAYLYATKYDLAIEDFNSALIYNYNQPFVHINLGTAYLNKSNIDMACFHYYEAIALGYSPALELLNKTHCTPKVLKKTGINIEVRGGELKM